MTLTQMLRKANSAHQYWRAAEPVLLAISGGVDSMALLHAMQQLPMDEKPMMTILHVHHHLRSDADLDYELVAEYCLKNNLPYVVKHWHNPPTNNVEEAARLFRYQFFIEQMREKNSQVLLTAHHADDQMETILMRLVRGSTLAGYAGIQKERTLATGRLIRPLLAIEKKDLYAYCEAYNVPFREDESNESLLYSRNRYRNVIVPLIKQENEQAAKHFGEFSESLTDLLTIAEPLIVGTFEVLFKQEGVAWELSIPLFKAQSESMQRMVLSHFLTKVWEVPTQRQHFQQLLLMIESEKPQTEITLAGGIIQKRYDTVRFKRSVTSEPGKLQFNQELELNAWLQLPFNGKIGLFLSHDTAPAGESQIQLNSQDIKLPLIVRNWQPGDTIRMNKTKPFTKKVARIFIDKKVPMEKRHQVWIVTDSEGKVLLVPGYASSIWIHELGDIKIIIKK